MGPTSKRRQGLGRIWGRCAPRLAVAEIFPPIEAEFGAYKHYFKGNVLNAGAGNRDIRHLIQGKLFNQDIPTGLHNANIDILSPLHQIPVEAGFFDAIICNAVLEHVENPEEVMREFQRVCKPGGILYLVVPFIQPEHLDPTDFQRYTIAGLQRLVRQHGFEVVEANGVHSVYTTLAWIFIEWLNAADTFDHFVLKWLFFPYLKRKCRQRGPHVHSLASAYRVVGRRTTA
jgi:SAM-dependent methyltransferase